VVRVECYGRTAGALVGLQHDIPQIRIKSNKIFCNIIRIKHIFSIHDTDICHDAIPMEGYDMQYTGLFTLMRGSGTLLVKLEHDNNGVTAIEYGLIAALIAVVAVNVMGLVGSDLSATFSTIASNL
jgi:pilus assembly protein Flp/PilA